MRLIDAVGVGLDPLDGGVRLLGLGGSGDLVGGLTGQQLLVGPLRLAGVVFCPPEGRSPDCAVPPLVGAPEPYPYAAAVAVVCSAPANEAPSSASPAAVAMPAPARRMVLVLNTVLLLGVGMWVAHVRRQHCRDHLPLLGTGCACLRCG
jgi:hypothetical protein